MAMIQTLMYLKLRRSQDPDLLAVSMPDNVGTLLTSSKIATSQHKLWSLNEERLLSY